MITLVGDRPLLEKRIRQVVTLSKDVHEKTSIFELTLDDAIVSLMLTIKQDLQ